MLIENITEGYAGEHYLDENNNVQVNVVSVRNGEQKPLKHIVRHSPKGFEWGYSGAGPSDLAISILDDVVGSDIRYQMHYSEFWWTFIRNLDYARWEIDLVDISEWLASKSER